MDDDSESVEDSSEERKKEEYKRNKYRYMEPKGNIKRESARVSVTKDVL